MHRMFLDTLSVYKSSPNDCKHSTVQHVTLNSTLICVHNMSRIIIKFLPQISIYQSSQRHSLPDTLQLPTKNMFLTTFPEGLNKQSK